MDESTQITHAADHPDFLYLGRWHVDAAVHQAITITNAATVEFGFTGSVCWLLFDVSKVLVYPNLAVWVDGWGPTRVPLDARGIVSLPLPQASLTGAPLTDEVRNARHHVRFMANMDSGYLTNIDNWNSQQGAVAFRGVALGPGESLFRLPLSTHHIEFLGDSITAGLGVLKTESTAYVLSVQYPEGNWPEWAARWLGMRPIVNGHGGQGIVSAGTGGIPPAREAFGFVFHGKAWNPSIKPALIVIYHGTNDGAIPSDQYRGYLATVRAAYPQAIVFAIVPHNRPDHVAPIQAAVQAMSDPRVLFLNYSRGVIDSDDTSDGTHLNPGGAVRLAVRLTEDIQAQLDALA